MSDSTVPNEGCKAALKCGIPVALVTGLFLFCFLFQEQAYNLFKPLIELVVASIDVVLIAIAGSAAQVFVQGYSAGWFGSVAIAVSILVAGLVIWQICAVRHLSTKEGSEACATRLRNSCMYLISCWRVLFFFNLATATLLLFPGAVQSIEWLIWTEFYGILLVIFSTYAEHKLNLKSKWI
jgi:hypothetical protein